jgi:mono/diheme cytochrome c family protein
LIVFTSALISMAGLLPAAALVRAPEVDGGRLYRTLCVSCHGDTGRGDGPDAAIFAEAPRNLRDGFLDAYSKDDLIRRVREGRALELTLDRPALRAQAANVEALVDYLQRLPAIDWARAAEGRDIYADRCVPCHGPYGRPGKALPHGVRGPRDLSDATVQRSIRDDQLITLVRHGRKGMPALTARVPEAEGRPLATFVRLLSPGFALYDRYCASCHGDDGRPAHRQDEVIRVPTIVFDRAYFGTHDAEQLRAKAWHMLAEQRPAMPHYRWALTDNQAEAIIEYLKSLK